MLPPEIEATINADIPRMEGWSEPRRCCEMAEIIIERRPSVVVEIGVFGGRTLVAQALALRHNNRGVIYGVDPWKVEPALEGENEANCSWWKGVDLHKMHQLTVEAIWKHKLDDFAVLIRSTSQVAVHLFEGLPTIGVLFIDGNHSEVASCRDVERWLPCVRAGGLVWMDDCNWPTTQKAQQLLLDECREVQTKENDGKFRLFARKH